jgi:hypothetical protein
MDLNEAGYHILPPWINVKKWKTKDQQALLRSFFTSYYRKLEITILKPSSLSLLQEKLSTTPMPKFPGPGSAKILAHFLKRIP